MRQKSGPVREPATQVLKNIRRATRRHFSAEDKIRIVLEGLRGEDSIAELCRREGIVQNLYYRWSKDFLEHDRRGRDLPVWQGCRVIAQGEVFLMNWDEPESLDSRYFGPIPLSAIVGPNQYGLSRRNDHALAPQIPRRSLIDHRPHLSPFRPTSDTPPHAMAVENMLSDCPKIEPARNWAACAGQPQGHRRPGLRGDASTAIGVNLHGPRDPDRRLRAQR